MTLFSEVGADYVDHMVLVVPVVGGVPDCSDGFSNGSRERHSVSYLDELVDCS